MGGVPTGAGAARRAGGTERFAVYPSAGRWPNRAPGGGETGMQVSRSLITSLLMPSDSAIHKSLVDRHLPPGRNGQDQQARVLNGRSGQSTTSADFQNAPIFPLDGVQFN